MKKNIFLLLSCLQILAADAVDEPNFYAKILGGANFLQDTTITENNTRYDTGYIVAGSVGYSLPSGLNLEGEYAFRRNDINRIHFFGQGSSKNGHFKTSSIMGNLLWNGCAIWDIEPFIGAGIGYDWQEMNASNSRIIFHQKWRHFSWQVMGGVAYPIYCNTAITLEYKFHQGGSHFNHHSLGIGLEFKFD